MKKHPTQYRKGRSTLMGRKFAESLVDPAYLKSGERGRAKQKFLAKARKLGRSL